MTLETQTESALSDYVKKFLLEFKDENGNFRYVDDIDNMMPSKSKFITLFVVGALFNFYKFRILDYFHKMPSVK